MTSQYSSHLVNPEYKNTVLHFIPEGKPSEFWVITAWNPDGKDSPVAENKSRDHELRQTLEARGLRHFRVIGTSADEEHGEPGWGIVTDEGSAIELGREFFQEAIFHIQGDTVHLISCLTREITTLPSLNTLLQDPRDVRLFTISVGAPTGGKFDDENIQTIREMIQSAFTGCTLRRVEGCFEDQFEEVLLIDIGTREYLRLLELADEIRMYLNQKGVGITCNGIYQKVREWTDHTLILESFGTGSGVPNNRHFRASGSGPNNRHLPPNLPSPPCGKLS